MNQVTIYCISMVMTAIIGCSKANSGTQSQSPSDTTIVKTEEPAAKIPSKQGDEPLNRNAWLAASEKNLTKWFGYHSQAINGFDADDFVVIDTFHEVEFTSLDLTEVDPGLVKYRFPSPDNKLQLDIYSYGKQLVSDGKNKGRVEMTSKSLESEVALYGIKGNKKLRLLFCGDVCRFEDAVWLDNDRIIIAGTSSEHDQKNHPMLWGIKLGSKSVYRFMHPAEVTEKPMSFFNAVIVPQ